MNTQQKNGPDMKNYNAGTLAIIIAMIAIIVTAAAVSLYNMAHIM